MNAGMSLTPSLISQAATSVAETPTAAQILALRKALQVEQQGALALLQALPQPAPNGELPLATQGPLGTRLNVMA
ncbi:putative motility protein [Tepidimonas charontis]|uniref:Motility protein n=1 Tax=Tepidimonas charontis TaxID=2267262 RepID=A0A554XG36_9BURK|nr:putative motility protein [Tepidimonas charontis]TSE34785.1 hypothetical protein Tchar_01138 [Tepidimonas charontis]